MVKACNLPLKDAEPRAEVERDDQTNDSVALIGLLGCCQAVEMGQWARQASASQLPDRLVTMYSTVLCT